MSESNIDQNANPYGVEKGQQWVSTDKRAMGFRQTVLDVKDGKAQMSGEFRKSWVSLQRFKPGSNGYRRVK